MRRGAIESSVIARMGYSAAQRLLELEFRKDGHVYQYFDVPPEEHTAFCQAESKGTYLNQVFKQRQYRCTRIK